MDFNQKQTPLGIAPTRTLVQAGFGLFCLWAGYRFYGFYLWALERSDTYVPRPPSVEAFLPISALLALKRLLLTGLWDRIHPAGLTIFLAALVVAWALRKGFCGWICPAGLVSNLLEKAGRPIALPPLPRWVEVPLLGLKYVLLAFFAWVILVGMDLGAIDAFLRSPYNLAADAKMLQFFLPPSALTVGVLGFLVLVSLVIRNFWCRFLCPYGALLGLLALIGPLRVRRDPAACIDCGRCDRVCPAAIRVSRSRSVRRPECVGCMECVEACPREGCLTLAAGGRALPVRAFPLAVVGLFLLFYLGAVLTGRWETAIPPEMFRPLYQSAGELAHP